MGVLKYHFFLFINLTHATTPEPPPRFRLSGTGLLRGNNNPLNPPVCLRTEREWAEMGTGWFIVLCS